jgi:hypothetical protein
MREREREEKIIYIKGLPDTMLRSEWSEIINVYQLINMLLARLRVFCVCQLYGDYCSIYVINIKDFYIMTTTSTNTHETAVKTNPR